MDERNSWNALWGLSGGSKRRIRATIAKPCFAPSFIRGPLKAIIPLQCVRILLPWPYRR